MLFLREGQVLRKRPAVAGRMRMEMMPDNRTQVAVKVRGFLEAVVRSGRLQGAVAKVRETQ